MRVQQNVNTAEKDFLFNSRQCSRMPERSRAVISQAPAYGDGYQQGPGYGNFQGGPQPNPYQGQPQPQVYQVPPQPQGYQQPMPGYYNNPAIDPSWPVKSKLCAGLLGIFLGTFGIHKFYMGKVGMGILYICFCWTYIPAIVGFIEGIMYLCSSDENFMLKHHVRVR